MRAVCSVKSVVVLLCLMMVLAACSGKGSGWKGTITQEGGVTVVKNPLEPLYGEESFSLEEEVSIGIQEGPEEYMFQHIRSIAVNEEGTIYILDYGAKHVKMFDPSGEYVGTFGRPGEGPGEFQLPLSIVCTPQGEIVVGDGVRVSFLSPQGEDLRGLNTGKFRISVFKVDSQGNFLGRHIDREENAYILKKFDPQFSYINSFASSPLPSESRKRGNAYNAYFSLVQWDVVNGDQVVCGYAEEGYKLKVYDADGSLLRRIEKQVVPLEIPREEAEKTVAELPPEMRQNVMVPKHYPVFRWVGTDDQGRIFVATYQKSDDGESTYYDIFDSEGRYIVRVPLPFYPRIMKEGKLYCIAQDDEGYQSVKRFRINWAL
jgi:hypothetical protein